MSNKKRVGRRAGARGKKQLVLPGLFLSPHPHSFLVRVSSDGDDRMGAKIETQKSPWTKKPQNIWCGISEPWPVWMYFFRRTTRPRYAGTNTNLQLFQIPLKKPYLNQTAQKYTRQIFLPKKDPWIESFKSQQILRSSPSLEIRCTPPER